VIRRYAMEFNSLNLFTSDSDTSSYNAKAESIDLYDAASIALHPTSLTRGGMILVGLLSGNDYDPVCAPIHPYSTKRCI
jgi:hypothetical protein